VLIKVRISFLPFEVSVIWGGRLGEAKSTKLSGRLNGEIIFFDLQREFPLAGKKAGSKVKQGN